MALLDKIVSSSLSDRKLDWPGLKIRSIGIENGIVGIEIRIIDKSIMRRKFIGLMDGRMDLLRTAHPSPTPLTRKLSKPTKDTRRGRRTDAGDAGNPRRGTYASRQGTGPRLPLCARTRVSSPRLRWCSLTRAGTVSATRSSALLPPSSPSLPPPSLTRVFVPAFHASG